AKPYTLHQTSPSWNDFKAPRFPSWEAVCACGAGSVVVTASFLNFLLSIAMGGTKRGKCRHPTRTMSAALFRRRSSGWLQEIEWCETRETTRSRERSAGADRAGAPSGQRPGSSLSDREVA